MRKTQKLKQLVITELNAIKKLPFSLRKETLIFDLYRPKHSCYCIYGLLTGESLSPIGVYIKNTTAVPYTRNLNQYDRSRKLKFGYNIDEYSALEFLIFNIEKEDPLHKEIFDFLLDKRENISL